MIIYLFIYKMLCLFPSSSICSC